MALIDHFLPALAFAAMLASEENLADTPFETARTDMERLLDEAVAKARRRSPEQADHAHFAACAFADEVILDSAWTGREAWMRLKLQEARFNTANAGLEFYQRLENLCADPALASDAHLPADKHRKEALEVYVTCLTLGFRGQYNDEQDQAPVSRLTGANLQRLLGDSGPSRDRIFPETYAVSLPEPEPARLSPKVKALILFGGPLLLALTIYAAYSALLSAFVNQWLAVL